MATAVNSRTLLTPESRGRQRTRAPRTQFSSVPIKNHTTYTLTLIPNVQERHETMTFCDISVNTESTEELLLGMDCEASGYCPEELESSYDIMSFEDMLSTDKETYFVSHDTSMEKGSRTYRELVEVNGNLEFDILFLQDDSEECAERQTQHDSTWSMIEVPTAKTDCKESEESKGDQDENGDDIDDLRWSLEVCIDEQDMQEINWRSCKCCFPED